MSPHYNNRDLRSKLGFSLAEIMIAITLGLLVVAGLTTLFVNNSRTQGNIDKSNRQIENGRYAIQFLVDDLRHAGFYAEYDPAELSLPSSLPDPCSTTISDIKAALRLHVQGYDLSASLSCISDRVAYTDVLVVRHVDTCAVGSTGCDAVVSGRPYFQASLCSDTSQLESSTLTDHYGLDIDTSSLTRQKRDCSTLADKRRFLTHIYFIAANNESGDGIPTLKRAELDATSGATSFKIVPLVEGVQNLQFEYGLDTNNDGAPDVDTANPTTYGSCTGAACVTNWNNVMTIKIHVLSRSSETFIGHTDTKSYTLGYLADGSPNTISAASDSYKRNVFQSIVGLTNPIGRRAP